MNTGLFTYHLNFTQIAQNQRKHEEKERALKRASFYNIKRSKTSFICKVCP